MHSSAVRAATRLKPILTQGGFLTDGTSLFRVVAIVSGSKGPTACELEDCRSLAVRMYSATEAASMDLVPVQANHVADEEPGCSAPQRLAVPG